MRQTFLLSVTALAAVAATDLGAAQMPRTPCEQYEQTFRDDPKNLDAAANLGRCTVRDEEVIASGGDSTRPAFRTSWNPALRALRQAVATDPTYSSSYAPLFRMLFAEMRDGCSRTTGECRFVAPIVRHGDSVLTPPRLVVLNQGPSETYRDAAAETRATERASLIEARSLAERWLAVAPNDRRPHEYLGRALVLLGDPIEAANSFERAVELGTPANRRALFWQRFAALVKANRGVDARRVLDEFANDPGRDTTLIRAWNIAGLHALLGRFRPPPIDSARRRADSARVAEIIRRSRPDTAPPKREPSIEALMAAGDTTTARRLIARMDSFMTQRPEVTRPLGQEYVQSARLHLVMRDTAKAEAQLAVITGLLDERRFETNFSLLFGDARPWMGRAWALAGDIAAARGRTDDAAQMYRRVIGLWEGGDPETKPVVEHARARLAALPRR